MTQFKAGDKVRRVHNNEARIWQQHPVVTVRWVSGNNVCFHELQNTYIASYFEPVKEPVKLDQQGWEGMRSRRMATSSMSLAAELMAMWVLTELAREGCLAWFGNSAKPEPETVTVEVPRWIVENWKNSTFTEATLKDAAEKALA